MKLKQSQKALAVLQTAKPQIIDAKFKVVRRFDEDGEKLRQKLELVFTAIGSLLAIAAFIVIEYYTRPTVDRFIREQIHRIFGV